MIDRIKSWLTRSPRLSSADEQAVLAAWAACTDTDGLLDGLDDEAAADPNAEVRT